MFATLYCGKYGCQLMTTSLYLCKPILVGIWYWVSLLYRFEQTMIPPSTIHRYNFLWYSTLYRYQTLWQRQYSINNCTYWLVLHSTNVVPANNSHPKLSVDFCVPHHIWLQYNHCFLVVLASSPGSTQLFNVAQEKRESLGDKVTWLCHSIDAA